MSDKKKPLDLEALLTCTVLDPEYIRMWREDFERRSLAFRNLLPVDPDVRAFARGDRIYLCCGGAVRFNHKLRCQQRPFHRMLKT